jgi:lysophospholipase L1-like esterase
MKMKKIISALAAGAIAVSSLSALAVSAADTKDDLVLFGDSIAYGYSVDNSVKYNYGEICADYLGGNVANYAVPSNETDDLLNVIDSLSKEQITTVKNAEYIVISIGGNDLMHYAAKYFLDYAVKKKLLADGVDASSIPEQPTIGYMMEAIDLEKVKAYAENKMNMLDLGAELKKLCTGLRLKNEDKGYPGIIPETVIPNIKTAVSKLKSINPDARIIVQTIYQPIQFDPELIVEEYGADSSYETLIGQIRTNFNDVIREFRKQLNTVEGIEVADVYYDFTSIPEGESQNNANPGNAHYFTNIQVSGESRDFHPNQKGHIAIASTILNTIGKLHDDSGLLTELYKNLNDLSDYPAIALDSYKTAAGNLTTGDINFDEKIDARDASLVLKNYAVISGKEKSILSELQNSVADVNKDESRDAKDASAILRYYAYLANNETGSLEEFLAQ